MVSQNRRHRLNGQNVYRRLFERILAICIKNDLVDGKRVLTDSTHVKANAAKKTEYKAFVEKEAAWYMERLDRYEALERERLEEEQRRPCYDPDYYRLNNREFQMVFHRVNLLVSLNDILAE